MTEISDAEAREALWASSEAGRAAVAAACEKADDLGFPRTGGQPAKVIEVRDIAAIAYAAHRAHEEVAELEAREEREERADERHVHRWRAKGVQEHRPLTLLGPPAVNTAVLARCETCLELTVFLLPGTWSWQDVSG